MKTLKSSINVKGVGLMSGVEFEVEVKPSNRRGIYLTNRDRKIKACPSNIISADHCVVAANVENGGDFRVALIEHFMAACAICSLDGVEMEFKGEAPAYEVPILDGSSKVWVEKFNECGYTGDEDVYPELKTPVIFQKDKSTVAILPSQCDTKITYAVNYNHPDLKNRWCRMNLDKNLNEIVEARTFGYLKDLETFRKMGLSKGVRIDNTVGMTDDGGYTVPLRSDFEPCKHKILDITGDLYLTGFNPLKIKADIIVIEAGHALHIEAAKLLEKALRGAFQDLEVSV